MYLEDGSDEPPPGLDAPDGLERDRAAHATVTSSRSGKVVLRARARAPTRLERR